VDRGAQKTQPRYGLGFAHHTVFPSKIERLTIVLQILGELEEVDIFPTTSVRLLATILADENDEQRGSKCEEEHLPKWKVEARLVGQP
jgi:hypothetical protein